MMKRTSRRDILKGSLALAGLGVVGLPEWALPALAQGETAVPFTDLPDTINWSRTRARDPFGEKLIPALRSLLEPPESAATSAHRPHSERVGDVP